MGIQLAPRRSVSQKLKTALVDWQMMHFFGCARGRPNHFQFIIAPKSPVEHNEIRFVNSRAKWIGYLIYCWGDEGCGLRVCVTKLKCCAAVQSQCSNLNSSI